MQQYTFNLQSHLNIAKRNVLDYKYVSDVQMVYKKLKSGMGYFDVMDTFNSIFKEIYSDTLKDLLYNGNLFIRTVKDSIDDTIWYAF